MGTAARERQRAQIEPVSTNSTHLLGSHPENRIVSPGIKENGQTSQINPCRYFAKTKKVLVSSVPSSGV